MSAPPVTLAAVPSDDAWRRRRFEAFAVLDEARLLKSYRLATLILRNRDEAEDATQEAIAQAWSRWETLRDTSRFDSWFDRILVNICRNRLRHARTIRVVPIDDAFFVPAADDHGARRPGSSSSQPSPDSARTSESSSSSGSGRTSPSRRSPTDWASLPEP
jgi:DNA-directed RNA polymerase specialized sigma24 family protein